MKRVNKKQKSSLIKSSPFTVAVAIAIFVIGVNLCMLVSLLYVIVSPRFEVLSTSTFVIMGAASVLNILILLMLLVLRRIYESIVYKKILIPLREIEKHIADFAQGEYENPVVHDENDEIGDLFKAVERVRNQLIEYREHEKNEERVKQIYISGLMHDIATPITRINGCASMIEDGMVKDEESIKRFASMILRNTEDINIMLKSLAAIVKYNETDSVMDLQPVDLSSVLENYVNDFNLSSSDVTITFADNCKQKSVTMIDIKSCKRALTNLINNSVKYKKQGEDCVIAITLEDSEDGKILFSLADNGVGVEPGSEDMLFEMFYRGDRARRNTNEGSGLGLFIAKQILSLNNIAVWAKNNGNGLTVYALIERKSNDNPL